MQALLLGTETIQEFLAELAGLAVRAVGEGLSCGITLEPNGRPMTVASTDALAAQVDEVQYGLDQGPCLHALRTGTQVSIDDLATDRRWVAYAATALQHGIRSSLSLPLSSGTFRPVPLTCLCSWNGGCGTQPGGGGVLTCE